jgi:RNA polymerase sigma factor (sigma-70 family)
MPASQASSVIHHLRRAALLCTGTEPTDGQLLGCFLERHDEAAFAALVCRHGPMVLGVCRRILRHHHDAEDAFQATFLVLARKAASIHPRDMLPGWLHGVACKTARKARTLAVKRAARERQVPQLPEPEQLEREAPRDLRPVIDEELARLPVRYRAPIVLCDLEGKTHQDAARQLGCPQGTVSGRLSRGRRLLARRLARRGLALSAVSLGLLLKQAAAGSVPPLLLTSTVRAASLVAAGQQATGVITATVAALTQGVLRSMLVLKLESVAVGLLVLVLAGLGAGVLVPQVLAEPGPQRGPTEKREVPPADRPAAKPAPEDSFAALKKEFDTAFAKHREERQKEAAELVKAAEERRRAGEEEWKAAEEKRKAAVNAAEKALRDAKSEEQRQEAQKKLRAASVVPARPALSMPALKTLSAADGPGETFSPRFLAFAVSNPKDPAALDALVMALVTSGGPAGKPGTWGRVVAILGDGYATKPEIKEAVRLLAQSRDEAGERLLRKVMADNPDREVQGLACHELAKLLANEAKFGEYLAANANARRPWEETLGKKAVEQRIAGAPEAKKEAEELSRTFREKYGDLFPDLSVGRPAPEVVSQDADGKPVKLSDLKGKVVLSFWTTTCSACLKMIPQEQALVKRYEGKPFVLVSVNADEDREAFQNYLAKKTMPWTHWWDGQKGGIREAWCVEGFPTIYVLDAGGVIRAAGVEGDKLEETVSKLVQEAETK